MKRVIKDNELSIKTISLEVLTFFFLSLKTKKSFQSLYQQSIWGKPLCAVASSFCSHPHGAADRLGICLSLIHMISEMKNCLGYKGLEIINQYVVFGVTERKLFRIYFFLGCRTTCGCSSHMVKQRATAVWCCPSYLSCLFLVQLIYLPPWCWR